MKFQHFLLFLHIMGPSHDYPDSCQQLLNFKWLDNVVIRAVIKTDNLVVCLSLGCDYDDGHIFDFPYSPADFKTVQLRQHQIEQDALIIITERLLKAISAIFRECYLISFMDKLKFYEP